MSVPSLVTGVVVSMFVVVPLAVAQEAPPISAADMAVACSPPAAPTNAAHALRVIGAQDTVPRTVFGPRDLVIVSGGTNAGVQLGAEFFVRRTLTSRSLTAAASNDVITDGWIRIVAVNDDTSIARVERSCGAIFANDFLEPYAVPAIPAVDDTPIDADFTNLARVLGGSEGHRMAGVNQVLRSRRRAHRPRTRRDPCRRLRRACEAVTDLTQSSQSTQNDSDAAIPSVSA